MQNSGFAVKYSSVKYPEEIDTAAETSADVYVSMAGSKFGSMIITANLTSTKTAVCQLTCASDASGTGKSDVTGKTLTLTGGTSSCGVIDFRVEDLLDIGTTLYFVGVDITTNQNGDDIAAVLAQTDYAYGQGSLNPN